MAKASEALFRELAPRIMRDLIAEFPVWDAYDAAACLGNGGHESNGFKSLQEKKPMVPGSRGGWGWFQWTGPRRRNFEGWVGQNGLDASSYEANYGFLIYELKGSESAAVMKTANAKGLEAKVKAFELAFERAGIKHYDSRVRWANIAMEEWRAAGNTVKEKPAVAPKPKAPKPAEKPSGGPLPAEAVTDEKTVALVQGWLRNIGYTEVGEADGKIGTFTKGAIRAFRADHGLPPGDFIDAPMIVALATADRRKIAPERESATPADVREKVPEVQANFRGKIASWIASGIAGVGAAFGAVFDHLGSAKEYLEPIKDLFGDIPIWAWLMIVAAAAFFLSRQLGHGEAAGIAAFKEGARR